MYIKLFTNFLKRGIAPAPRIPDQHRWAAAYNYAAVGALVAHTGGRFAANKYASAAQNNSVWRAGTGYHIAHYCGGQATYQYSGAAWAYNGAANVRHQACYHWAYMHIS
jgi:hypothetical protein